MIQCSTIRGNRGAGRDDSFTRLVEGLPEVVAPKDPAIEAKVRNCFERYPTTRRDLAVARHSGRRRRSAACSVAT